MIRIGLSLIDGKNNDVNTSINLEKTDQACIQISN